LKGLYPSIHKHLKSHQPDDIKIPSIVKAELLYGAEKSIKRKENLEKMEQFLFPFEVVSFDSDSAQIYAALRAELEKKGKVIGPNDLIIAATVLSNQGSLVTNNLKEYQRIKKLKTTNWLK
jgi:tRNA(fMet)-specific endonuclease VapC